jgi:hypothetical protein
MQSKLGKFLWLSALGVLVAIVSTPAHAGSITTYQGTWLDGVGTNNSGMNYTATLTVDTNTSTYTLDFLVQNLNHTSTLNAFALQTFCCGSNPSFTIDTETIPANWTAVAGAKINNGQNGLGCNPGNGVAGWLCASANTMPDVLHLGPNGNFDFKFTGSFTNVSSIGTGSGQFDLMDNGLTDGNKYALSDGFDFHMIPTIPEPATMSVLGSGLLMLGAGLSKRLRTF